MPQNPVVDLVFSKITGMDSRPAFLLKRSFHQGCFSVDTSEFSALLQSGLASTLVLVKLQAVHCRDAID